MHKLKFILKALVFVVVLGAAGHCLFQLHLIYSADESLDYSEHLMNAGDMDRAITYANQAVDRNPLEPNYYRNRARLHLIATVNKDPATTMTYKVLALEDMKKAYQLNPSNLVTIRNLIPIYYFLATKDLTNPAGPNNIDANFVGVTQAFYAKVQDVSPNDVGMYALLLKYQTRLGLVEQFTKSMVKVGELRPDLFEWFVELPF